MTYKPEIIQQTLFIILFMVSTLSAMEKSSSSPSNSPSCSVGRPSPKTSYPTAFYNSLTNGVANVYSALKNVDPHKNPDDMTYADSTWRGLHNWYGNQDLKAKKLGMACGKDTNDPSWQIEWKKTEKVYATVAELSLQNPLPLESLHSWQNRVAHSVEFAQNMASNFHPDDNERAYRTCKEMLQKNYPAIPLELLGFFIKTANLSEKNLIQCTLPDNNEGEDLTHLNEKLKTPNEELKTLLQTIQAQYTALTASLQKLDYTKIQYQSSKKKWRKSA